MEDQETRGRGRNRDTTKVIAFRRKHWKSGCEVCGWRSETDRSMNVHHIIPASCGGGDADENLILLCPNHHSLAHTVGRRSRKSYFGPTDRAALILALREVDSTGTTTVVKNMAVEQTRELLKEETSDKSTAQQDDRNNSSKARIVEQLLREGKPGWTALEISVKTGFLQPEVERILTELYASGRVAFFVDSETMMRTWGTKARIVEQLLREGKPGWTALEISEETGTPQSEVERILTELYDLGRVAFFVDSEAMMRTWFDIPRILGMALDAAPDRANVQQRGMRQEALASLEEQAARLVTQLRALQGKA
jgi:transcription initiation factor IIE alpha subunit